MAPAVPAFSHVLNFCLRLSLGLGLGAACGLARAADQPAFTEVAAFRGAVLAEHGGTIKDWSMTNGALSLRMDQGTGTYLLAKGRPVGLYLKGKGAFSFRASDPSMKPTLLFNLAQNTKLTARAEGEDLLLGEPISEAVIWFAGRDLPAPEGTGQPVPAADYAALAATFGQRNEVEWVTAIQELNRPPVEQLLAYRTLNGLAQPLVTAELVAAGERYVYTCDPVYAHTESLFIQRPTRVQGTVNSIVLAGNALGWQRNAPPDPDFRLSAIDLDLEASRNLFARMKLKETIEIIRPNLRCLTFHFTQLHTIEPTHGKKRIETVTIRHLKTEDGRELAFDSRGGYLMVDLGRNAKKGERLKLSFEIEGEFLGNESMNEFNYWRLTPGSHWLPEPDQAGQAYTVEARIAVEKPFVAIASAKTVARTESATHNILTAKQDKPILWFSVAAGNYKPVELVRNNRTIRAWCYGGVPASAEMLLKTAHGILDFYDGILIGVPFDEINLVEVPALGFGQSPAGMIWLTREAFNPTEDLMTRVVAGYGATGGWANRMIAHELAHQYWGHRVKMYSPSDNWISEGFAEYTSSLAIRAMKKKGPMVYDDIVADWKNRAAKVAAFGTIPTTQFMQPRFPEEIGIDYKTYAYGQTILYAKGAYLLACLHKDLGDEAFFRFLRLYQKRLAWYPPSIAQDVPDLLKAVTGRDFNPWMKDNYWGTAMPPLGK